MGGGIAQVVASSRRHVSLYDAQPGATGRALATMRKSLTKLEAKGGAPTDDVLRRITVVEDLVPAALMIEAVVEDADTKEQLFHRADEELPPAAILASNTSSIPIGTLAAATNRPDRVIGMHFFNPVPVMALLEVVRAVTTSDATVAAAVEVGRKMGKDPIVVRDTPGFATSRLGVLLGLEAIRMLEQEVGTAEDIDKAMTLGYRHPMGPLRLTDLVGLDVRLAIAEHLHRELKSEAFRVPDLMRRMVAEGKLGKKCGEGFYRWDS